MLKKTAIFLFMALFFITPFAMAEEKEVTRLEDVSVTATRTERTTQDIPAGVTTVTKEDIKNTRMFNLKEGLTGISGIQAETKNGGYDARLIIRGAGLKARYGIREIMVLMDGVPITDPDGMTRLDFVDTQLVEQIDIVKGPNSTLYGANAAGGVINIITKSPFEEIKSVKLGYGDNNAQMYNLTYGNHIGNTYLTLSGSRRSTDGWRKWNEFETNQGSLKIGHMFNEKTHIEANISYTKADLQLPGTLTEAQFNSDPSQLTSDTWRHAGRYSEIFWTSLKFETEIGNFALKPMAYFNSWDHYHPVTGSINDGGADVYGVDFQIDYKHNVFGMGGILTTGISGQIDEGKRESYTYKDCMRNDGVAVNCTSIVAPRRISYTLSDAKGDLASTSDDTITKWGVYIQESIRPTDKWIIDMGIRYDEVDFDINTEKYIEYSFSLGRYITSIQSTHKEKTFDYVSPRIGVVYKLTDIFNLYGNISTGFQTPQSSELGVNSNLKPSETYNYEIGTKARFKGGHSLDLSLFYIKVKDDIVQTIEPGNVSSYSNAGKSEKKGVELSGKVQTLEGLFLGGSYTYSDFKFVEFNEVISNKNYSRDGNQHPYVPMHQYSLFASYKHPSGFKARIDTNTWGEYWVDNANSEKYKGYEFITNAIVGYEWKGLDLSLTVNNIFDNGYAMEVTKESGGSTKYRPGAPMSAMLTLTYNF